MADWFPKRGPFFSWLTRQGWQEGEYPFPLEDFPRQQAFVSTTPQESRSSQVSGWGVVLACAALFAGAPPAVDDATAAASYQTGTHEASIRQTVSLTSRTWAPFKGTPAAAIPGSFLESLPQSFQTSGSGIWCAAEYTTRVTFLSSAVVGDSEEPRYQPSNVWGQEPPSAVVQTTIVRPIQAAVQTALQSSGSWVKDDVAQQAALLVFRPKPIFATVAEVLLCPESRIWGEAALFTAEQPSDTGASYAYGQHNLLYDYAGRSSVWGNAENTPVIISLSGKVLLTTQESVQNQGSFVKRSWLYFDSPPIRQISGYQEPNIQTSGSRITESWQFPLVAPQSPPNRPAIQTSAEVPRDVPSSVWGSVATYAPEQPGDTGASYAFGQHSKVYEYAGLSKVWGRPGYVPPVVESPPLRGAIVTSQDVKGALQNWSAVWPTPVANLVPFITTAVVGDFDPPPYQASSIWRHPHVPFVSVQILRPMPFSGRDYRAEFSPNPSVVQSQAAYVVQVTFLSQTPVGEQQEPWYAPSTVWRSGFIEAVPPPPPPLRNLIQTFPQPDLQQRPSSRWKFPPPSVIPTLTVPAHFSISPHWGAQYYEVNRSTIHPTLQRYCYMGRIVTYPKYLGETEQLLPPFDFSGRMGVSETISSASIAVTVYSGVDSNPSAIKSGSPTISGKKVYQNFTGGVVGVIYLVSCTANTSAGQVLVLNTYFYVEPDLP